jgi:MFS family permease
MFLIPLATSSYTLLVILCAMFGVTFASSFSFTPIITSRLVDMDDFTLAYGLILLVQGVGSLVGPPIAGSIFDITGRWVGKIFAKLVNHSDSFIVWSDGTIPSMLVGFSWLWAAFSRTLSEMLGTKAKVAMTRKSTIMTTLMREAKLPKETKVIAQVTVQ